MQSDDCICVVGIVQNELVKGIDTRHGYPVLSDRQIYFPMGPVMFDRDSLDREVGEKFQVRYNSNSIIDGYKTGNGHLLLHLTYDIRFNDAGVE